MQIQLTRYGKFMVRLAMLGAAALVLFGLFIFGSTMAKADGYESYKDEPREYRDSYRRSRSYVAKCDRYLSAWECRRFRAKMAERANGGYREPVRSRRVYAETRYEREPVRRVRYAESRRYTSDVVEIRGTRECKAPISVEGEERGSVSRARGNASDTWKRVTIARYGYRFADLDVARSPRYDCVVLRKNKFGWPIHSCSLAARPCRDM